MSTVAAVALSGIAASGGTSAGPVFIVSDAAQPGGAAASDYGAAVDTVAERLERLAAALPATRRQAAEILRAQAVMARDPALAASVQNLQQGGRSAADAVRSAAESYAARLASLPDPYLRERASDIRDVGRQIVAALIGASGSRLAALARPSVVVARELSPADTLSVEHGLLLAIVTEEGGYTSHAAIVARELGIPAVVGVRGALEAAALHAGAEVDGGSGRVVFVDRVITRAAEGAAARLDLVNAPVALMANVGSREAAAAAAARGAAGIGLFRTELMFMRASGPMSEDEQLAVYGAACAAFAPHPVVVRTLDAGADKPLPYLPEAHEANPQLGRRGIRLWLEREELWRPQVRALVRTAAANPNLKVMLPMIAARGEMLAARRRFEQESAALLSPVPELGMMVEVPAAAVAIDTFAGVADFISLGTNDLTQYTVAADRGAEWGADLSELNPGVLRLIAGAITGARKIGIPAGVCGELAGQPAGAVFLVGVGASSLSMTVSAIPAVLEALSRLGTEGCRRAAQAALAARDSRTASTVLSNALAQS